MPQPYGYEPGLVVYHSLHGTVNDEFPLGGAIAWSAAEDNVYIVADTYVVDTLGGDFNEGRGFLNECSNASCTTQASLVANIALPIKRTGGNAITPSVTLTRENNATVIHVLAQEDRTCDGAAMARLHEWEMEVAFIVLIDERGVAGAGANCYDFGSPIIRDNGVSDEIHAGWTRKDTSLVETAMWGKRDLTTGGWSGGGALAQEGSQSDHADVRFTTTGGVRAIFHDKNESIDFEDPVGLSGLDVHSGASDWPSLYQEGGTWHAAYVLTGTKELRHETCSTNCATTGTWAADSSFNLNLARGNTTVRHQEFIVANDGSEHNIFAVDPTGSGPDSKLFYRIKCPGGGWNPAFQPWVSPTGVNDSPDQRSELGRPGWSSTRPTAWSTFSSPSRTAGALLRTET